MFEREIVVTQILKEALRADVLEVFNKRGVIEEFYMPFATEKHPLSPSQMKSEIHETEPNIKDYNFI